MTVMDPETERVEITVRTAMLMSRSSFAMGRMIGSCYGCSLDLHTMSSSKPEY